MLCVSDASYVVGQQEKWFLFFGSQSQGPGFQFESKALDQRLMLVPLAPYVGEGISCFVTLDIIVVDV